MMGSLEGQTKGVATYEVGEHTIDETLNLGIIRVGRPSKAASLDMYFGCGYLYALADDRRTGGRAWCPVHVPEERGEVGALQG